ncbi:ubiquitin-like small modifier protein 1 [Breoghania sp. JC706]|uniref:ubiquitin-like small modifier protein 1 n=1 Tax=Breoghania sp. JC706 TaxID=3117732 RepID=UPI00300AFB9B
MKVRYFALLRDITGCKEEEWTRPADTVGGLIHDLVARYGSSFERWVMKDGKIWDLVMILVNGRDVRQMSGFETPLKPDDTIVIFPPVGGG